MMTIYRPTILEGLSVVSTGMTNLASSLWLFLPVQFFLTPIDIFLSPAFSLAPFLLSYLFWLAVVYRH